VEPLCTELSLLAQHLKNQGLTKQSEFERWNLLSSIQSITQSQIDHQLALQKLETDSFIQKRGQF